MVLAVERGELDGRCGWAWSSIKISRPEWIADKKIKILNVLALERSPELPDVPAIMEFVKAERHKQIFRFVLNAQTLGRPFVAAARHSGGSRRGAAQGLRRHHEGPGLSRRDDGQEARCRPDRWQAIGALLKDFYATPQDVVDETRAIISE